MTFSTALWNAKGPLMVGAGQWNGALAYIWNGGLDNVGVFNGVLSANEISNLYQYNNPYYVSD